MNGLKQVTKPFEFYTRMRLVELLGLKAFNLSQLAELIKQLPGSCIYHHTHGFLERHEFLSPEPPNDFAYWVSNILNERELGERLASIDTILFTGISELRNKIVETIENYLTTNPNSKLKFARAGDEFHFMKSVSFIISTHHTAHNLNEFVEILKKITIESIYFHIFEARIRLGKRTNDFSEWVKDSVGDKALAHEIVRLDPYTRTLENLRHTLIRIISEKIGNENGNDK